MRRPLALFFVVASLGATLAACFSPQQPACTFACGPGGACPADYVCASDNLCHLANGQGQCTFSAPDGSADGAPSGSPDGAAD